MLSSTRVEKSLQIHAIAESPKEDLFNVLVNLCGKMEFEVPERHLVEAVHRLKQREIKVAPIIVIFTYQATKDLCITKKKSLRVEKVFLNNNQPKPKYIFLEDPKARKTKGYKFEQTKKRKVLVKKEQGFNISSINAAADLAKLS